jgi:NTP pyrophosphatase (non-canonical NTP hydrolase)
MAVIDVLTLARYMQINLLTCGKTGWQGLTRRQCLNRANQELKELRGALNKKEPPNRVWDEAADVANFLLFLCINYQRDYNESRKD